MPKLNHADKNNKKTTISLVLFVSLLLTGSKWKWNSFISDDDAGLVQIG